MTAGAGAAVGLRHTPLHAVHESLGARLLPFAGFSMPVDYGSAVGEHTAVRTAAGIFDVSHMGQLRVRGPQASRHLQRLLSNDITRLDRDGLAQYTLLTNQQGGIEDDLIAYRLADDDYLLVVNAANVAHDAGLVAAGLSDDTSLDDQSERWAMIALQGPDSDAVAQAVGVDLTGVGRFELARTSWNGRPLMVAGTGYTGEHGYELLVDGTAAVALWQALADAGARPCGLACRDTLRLEMCYPLHGNDIGPDTSAVGAGLGWACALDTDFVGRDALLHERESGSPRLLRAIVMSERAIPRKGMAVVSGGTIVGDVTSGSFSPTLGQGIALAWVDAERASIGSDVQVDVRGRLRTGRIVRKPFLSKKGDAG